MHRKRVLAVASGGGHWVQLMRLRPALNGEVVSYGSSRDPKPKEIGDARYYAIPEANRHTPIRMLRATVRVATVVVLTRPDVVISTGAAPGAMAIAMAKLIGARTVWIDSIANARKVSMSGRLVRPFADLWLTQWEHLARATGPKYRGTIV